MRTNTDWQFDSGEMPEQWRKTNRFTGLLQALALINLAVIAAAPAARYYLDAPGFLSFRIMAFAMLAGLTLGALALVILGLALIKRIRPATRRCLIVFLAGVIPMAAVLLYLGPDAMQKPMIHDISTDTEDPPQYRQVDNIRTPGQNSTTYGGQAVAYLQHQAYPQLQPIYSFLPRDAAMDEAIQVVKDLRWEFINIDYEEGIIEAYDTSPLFGFVDDVVIRVRREGAGSRIDVRSSSRVGTGDLGKNAERIRQFIAAFRG